MVNIVGRAKPKVFIQGPGGFSYMKMFISKGFAGTTNSLDADIVCFTGGEDVNPALYEERALGCSKYDVERDKNDLFCFTEARLCGMYMVGICRGGQFLNVMCGGKLWQDVSDHRGPHMITDHKSGDKFLVTSTHHQMMLPDKHGEILASTRLAKTKAGYGREWTRSTLNSDGHDGLDAEAIWYDANSCLCFQPHPEWGAGSLKAEDYLFRLLEETGGFKGGTS